MLQFHEIINLKEEVSKGLNAESWISHSGDILIPDSVCIVGKERDCSFLFRCVTQNGAGSNQQSMPSLKKRTHIGIFSLQDNRVRTLLTLDKEEEIIHCTVNEQQTLLAFCVASDGPIKARTTTTREMRLYVADVQHGVRRDTVQFEIVAGRLENTKSAQFIHQADRKVKLVVFEHSEYIGVVQLAVDSAGKLKDKVAKRYKPDWIIGKHFWYQWDVDKQHLFTITSDNSDMGGFLDVYQPSERTTLDKLFSIPIMIDTSRRPRLSKFNLEQRSQDRNIVVLTNNDNTTNAVLCLCNQEPYKRRNPNEPDLPFTLSYEIISFVHEKSLRISVPNVPSKLRKMCIHFTLIGNYVVAYLPDVFTHVINVQDIADLGALNIICGGESHSRVAECKSTLSRLNLSRLYTKPGTYMFDSDSMYIYNIVFNDQAIEAKFAEKWPQEIHAYPAVSPRSLTNQLAVLQQVLQSTADAKKPRKLFDYMMNDAASTDCIQILTEYLLGSSFAVTSRRNEVIKVFCCLLPFTSSQTQESHKVSVGAGRRNGVEERDGRKDDRQQITIQACNCSCQHIEVSNENALKRNSEFFPFLHLLKRKRAVKRFRVEELSRRMVSDESAIKKKTPSIIDSLRNIIRNQSVAAGGTQFSERDRAGSLYSYNAVTFPDSLLNEDVDEKFVTNLANAIHEYVRKVYPLASGKISGIKGGKASPLSTVDIKKQELITMCWTYAKILLNQVKVLLHHLYNVFGLNQLHNMQYAARQPDDLLKAFHLLERYMFAVNKLGLPLPDEFATLFTTLAYQSHTPEEFMQYVNCGLVELTDGFLDVLAADKNIIKAPVKGECLALLPQPQALKWSHKLMESVGVAATATRLVAENLLSKYYNGRNSSGQGNLRRMSLTASSGGEVEESNPDLPQSYSHLVSRMTRAGWRENEEGSLTAPMLERAVFYYTTAEC